MRPYSVELFDRNLNYICNANIDPSIFSYSYDALNPTSNTVTISVGTVPEPANPEEVKSWYIRITRDDEEYQGLVKAVSRGKEQDVIRYNPLIYLFDNKARVRTAGVIETASTDDYIRDVLLANFKNNTDTKQNIPYLSIVSLGNAATAYAVEYEYTESLEDWKTRMEIEHGLSGGQWFQDENSTVYSYCVWTRGQWVPGEVDEETGQETTPGYWEYYWEVRWEGNYSASTSTSLTAGGLAFSYAENSDPYSTISIIDELILPAAQVYFIFCKIKIDFEAKAIRCEIGLNMEQKKAIETALPSVFDSSITIKESNNAVNKAVIVYTGDMSDSRDGTATVYYMHPDGRFDTQNTNRLIPVKTDFETYNNVASTAEQMVQSGYKRYLDIFKTYAHAARDLTESEYQSLLSAVGVIMPLLFSSGNYQINILNDENLTAAGLAIRITNNIDGHYNYVINRHVIGWTDIGSQDRPGVNNSRYLNSHVYFRLNIDEGDGLFEYVITQDITDANATAAINYFLASEDYTNYVRILTQRATDMYKHQLATKAFAKSKYKNLIEFTVLADDALLKPKEMQEGQVVDVIHKGNIYNSILTGWKVSKGLIKLTFGTIRLELTKILRGSNV